MTHSDPGVQYEGSGGGGGGGAAPAPDHPGPPLQRLGSRGGLWQRRAQVSEFHQLFILKGNVGNGVHFLTHKRKKRFRSEFFDAP